MLLGLLLKKSTELTGVQSDCAGDGDSDWVAEVNGSGARLSFVGD